MSGEAKPGRWKRVLSAIGTVALLVVALLAIRSGLSPSSPDARRWTFIEGDPPEALGLSIEAPRAGAWSVAEHDHATGARALRSAVGEADAGPGLVVATDTFARDVVASTRCRTAPSHPERACGVVVRHGGPGTYYVGRADEARGVVEIARVDGGTERVLGSAPMRPHEGWRELVFEARGSRLRVTADGVHTVEASDGVLGAGHVGLWAAAACDAYFDELSLRKLHGATSETLPILQLGS